MTERILENYLSAGLLELNGQDAWFEHITTAADKLTRYIAANPEELTSFVYSAIDPVDKGNDPARAKVSEILKSVWKTYASVSMGSPAVIQKGIILDAIFQNIARDPQIKLAVALLFSSTLPYIDLGVEATVLQPILNQLIDDIEEIAETNWSVPESIQLPEIPEIEPPTLSARMAGVNFDSPALKAGLEQASGPQDSKANATNGNPHWPNGNYGQHWAQEFAPRAAESISDAVRSVAGTRHVSLDTDTLIEAVEELVETYITTVAEQLTVASYGVELRSRLLWWKEAKVSPSARVEYRSLPPIAASALIALDFQKMLPALAPVSVLAFLRETVRSIVDAESQVSFAEYLQDSSHSEVLAPYRLEQMFQKNDTGIRPFAELVTTSASGSENINELTLFDSKKKLSPLEFSVLLFTELQAHKAVAEVEAMILADGTEEQQESFEVDS